MRSFKEAAGLVFKNLKKDAVITTGKIATGDATAFTKGEKLTAIISSSIMMIFSSALVTFADTDIITTIESVLSEYYGKILAVTTILAMFLILVAILWTMASPSSHGAQTPIGWIRKILICWVIALLIPSIAKLVFNVTGVTQSMGTGR